MTDDDLSNTILQWFIMAVIGVITIGILVSLGASLSAGSAVVEGPQAGQAEVLDQASNDVPDNVEVRATTENAIRLDGSGAVEAPAPRALESGNWSVCMTLGMEGGDRGTYTAFAYDNGSMTLQYDDGEWVAYFDDGTYDARANVSASGSDSLTPVCMAYEDGVELTVHAEGSTDTDAMTTSPQARSVAWDWEGRQDEARVFNNTLSVSAMESYEDDPVAPMPGQDRAARFMFDEGSGTTTRIYFQGATADLSGSGATWAGGVSNPEKWLGLASAIDRGDDYELSGDPFSITVVEGGYLEGAPVVHVDWEGSLLGIGLIPLMTTFMALLIVVPLAQRVNERVNGGPGPR